MPLCTTATSPPDTCGCALFVRRRAVRRPARVRDAGRRRAAAVAVGLRREVGDARDADQPLAASVTVRRRSRRGRSSRSRGTRGGGCLRSGWGRRRARDAAPTMPHMASAPFARQSCLGGLRGRFQPGNEDLRARAPRVSSSAGASSTIVLPPPIVAPRADAHRRDQHAVRSRRARRRRSPSGACSRRRSCAVIEPAPKLTSRADRRSRRRTRGDSPSRRAPSVLALTSTKLPMCTSSPSVAPGRSRAYGPMRACAPIVAPSRCENALDRVPRADGRRRAARSTGRRARRRRAHTRPSNTQPTSMDDVARRSRACRARRCARDRRASRPPRSSASARRRCTMRSTAASCARSLTPRTSRLVGAQSPRHVDAVGDARARPRRSGRTRSARCRGCQRRDPRARAAPWAPP